MQDTQCLTQSLVRSAVTIITIVIVLLFGNCSYYYSYTSINRKPWFWYKITDAGMINLTFPGNGGGQDIAMFQVTERPLPFSSIS